MRAVHLSTIHRALDVRIFYKECRTLAAAGHQVHLLASDPPAPDLDGVTFHPFHRPEVAFRPARICKRLLQIYQQAARLKADVYHFHDPELILVGLLLRRHGARVVYDVHENTVQEALTLNPNRPWHGRIKSWAWAALESVARRTLDAFVCATPNIASHFPPHRTVTVQNFPLREELAGGEASRASLPYRQRPYDVAYAGGITRWRGLREMVTALSLLPERFRAQLQLAGEFSPPDLLAEAQQYPGWSRVVVRGFLTRAELSRLYGQARVGLVLLHPNPAIVQSQPIKLFEYMAAGLPLVASDFPLWRHIVAEAGCGLLVDPLDPAAIARAIAYLFDHPEHAEQLGKRGQDMVAACYNWDVEGKKLVALYQALKPSARQPGVKPRGAPC